MPFTTFGLSDPLVRGILATGYTAPTEIQSQALPAAISGKDIIGCAQTGTGKTAAFVLPILDRLHHEQHAKHRIPKALILTPTRELALQIEKSIKNYGRFVDVQALAVYGGVNIKGQINALRRGVNIVVATPGRLIDHLCRGTIDLRHIEVLVLDEADRMLDMGFINDVRRIVSALPVKRQTMLFSATISPEVKALAAGMQKSPEMIQIGKPRNPIETITQHIYPVRKEQKWISSCTCCALRRCTASWSSPGPNTEPTRLTGSSRPPASNRYRSTPDARRDSVCLPWRALEKESTRSWSQPISRRAELISKAYRT